MLLIQLWSRNIKLLLEWMMMYFWKYHWQWRLFKYCHANGAFELFVSVSLICLDFLEPDEQVSVWVSVSVPVNDRLNKLLACSFVCTAVCRTTGVAHRANKISSLASNCAAAVFYVRESILQSNSFPFFNLLLSSIRRTVAFQKFAWELFSFIVSVDSKCSWDYLNKL